MLDISTQELKTAFQREAKKQSVARTPTGRACYARRVAALAEHIAAQLVFQERDHAARRWRYAGAAWREVAESWQAKRTADDLEPLGYNLDGPELVRAVAREDGTCTVETYNRDQERWVIQAEHKDRQAAIDDVVTWY